MKNFNYKIKDTKKGIIADVELNEGVFNLEIKQLPFNKITGSLRNFEIVGNYPKEKYSISYEHGKLFIMEKNKGSFEVGQKVNHKLFSKGIVTNVSDTMVSIDFNGENKTFPKSIISNFLK